MATFLGDHEVTEVHRAMFEVEKHLQPGDDLTSGKVDWRVRYDNRLSHESVDSPRQRQTTNRDPEHEAINHNEMLWHMATPQDEKGIHPLPNIVPLDELPELPKFFDDPNALDAYDGIEDTSILERLITLAPQILAPRVLEVFTLRLDGFSYEQIGIRLGIQNTTARVQFRKAVTKLRAIA